QVHLLHAELFQELEMAGFKVSAGDVGENITTVGLDLLRLPTGTRLLFGDGAASLVLTGLRNPCRQLDRFSPGLMAAMLGREDGGHLVRKAGVMSIVATSGDV